jgi:dihydrofolate synthase / folylpolyglutamate synthase
MTYEAALARIGRALQFGINPSLEPVRDVCRLLGDPQKKYRVLQIGGTNGKTSVARMAAAILSAVGLRTGHYLSPHLEEYTERFVIDGAEIAPDELARALAAVMPAVEEVERRRDQALTEFELLTVMALQYFADCGCDVAVLEVGLGGRWDATTVCDPDVAVLTTIGLDHCDRLGPDEASIAREKVEIVKLGGRLVLGAVPHPEARAVILARAAETGVLVRHVGDEIRVKPAKAPAGQVGLSVRTPCGRYPRITLACEAPYQRDNAALAIAATDWLLGPLDPSLVRGALAGLTFPGRMERLSDCPTLVIDGAHNPEAAARLAEALRHAFAGERVVIALSIMADKDVAGIVRALAPLACAIVCTANRNPRALAPELLAEIVRRAGPGTEARGAVPGMPGSEARGGVPGMPGIEAAPGGAPPASMGAAAPVEVVPDLGAACERAIVLAGTDGAAVVTGSLYTAGEARAWWRTEGHRSCSALC